MEATDVVCAAVVTSVALAALGWMGPNHSDGGDGHDIQATVQNFNGSPGIAVATYRDHSQLVVHLDGGVSPSGGLAAKNMTASPGQRGFLAKHVLISEAGDGVIIDGTQAGQPAEITHGNTSFRSGRPDEERSYEIVTPHAGAPNHQRHVGLGRDNGTTLELGGPVI
jgi:hypothetical protein